MERAAYSSQKDALTQEAFDRFLALLHPDREQAGVEYTRLRTRLVRFFTLRNEYAQEDAADETLDRLARKLAAGATVENLDAYAFTVARMILQERNKKENRTQAAYQRHVNDPAQQIAEETAGPLDNPLLECLNTLPAADRAFLQDYFAELPPAQRTPHRNRLAAQLQSNLNTLRLKVHRLRLRLEECVNKRQSLMTG